MKEQKGEDDFSIFITVHAVERFYERALGSTEEEAKKLSSKERYNIVKMIERILKEEHPLAYELGKGMYHNKYLGIIFVITNNMLKTITKCGVDGEDRRLRGGALNNGKKYGKVVKSNQSNKYIKGDKQWK